MRLTVLPHPDTSATPPISAVFQAPGGTLGRSVETDLPLPDAERRIARVQAAVRISDGACYLVNLSSMGSVRLNGRPITHDQEVPLATGDELSIGPYRLKAEDPAAVPAQPAVAAAAASVAAGALAEPDPLLESPLLDEADFVAPASPVIHQVAPSVEPATTPASSVPQPAAEPVEAPEPAAPPPTALPAHESLVQTRPAAAEPALASTQPPAAPVAASAPLPGGFAEAPAAFDAPLDSPGPLLSDAPAQQSDPADVFSDLFGPGTLPVGSVPDVSAHPFDLESAQGRNPDDPLRHLPRGDANVQAPLRDPLDALGDLHDDDAHSVFSDPTPSTLPAHDPLAPHRSDPVTDTLNPRQHSDDARAARDHLREYGGYLRPSRVQPQDPPVDPAGKPRRP